MPEDLNRKEPIQTLVARQPNIFCRVDKARKLVPA